MLSVEGNFDMELIDVSSVAEVVDLLGEAIVELTNGLGVVYE